VPVVALCAVASVQWLAVHHDIERGLARVRAFVTEPPVRTPAERGTTWDFLGIRSFRLGQEADRDGHLDEAHRWFTLAEEAWRHAADTSPSPRILQEWALAATMENDYDLAQQVYRRFLAVSPDNVLGWLGYATVSMNRGDFPEARRGAQGLLRLRPGDETALGLIQQADTLEARAAARAAHSESSSTR
jgi:tetratricopeptide (TPR) repeat protein